MGEQLSGTILFLLSTAIIVYVVFGYPLLAALAARRPRPVRKERRPRKVTVLMPVRNGEPWIRAKLDSLLRLDYPRELLQIIVISDGSTDLTDEIVEEYAADEVQLIRIAHSGKAVALNAGMARARGEILFFTDVRQPLDPACLWRLVENFADPSVGVVSGDLIIRDRQTSEHTHVGLYWRYEKWIRDRLSAIDSVLGATGCCYAMRRRLAVPLPPGTLLDDVYLPLAAFFRGYRVIVEREAKAYDDPANLRSEFLRKVRTLAGVYQIVRAYPALLSPANRMWIHFVSHKIGRLLLPHALIVMAVATYGLPGLWREAAFGAQGLLYLSSGLDRWVPESWVLKPATSAARTFVVLMTAAFCAVPSFMFGGLDLWTDTRIRATARQAEAHVK